MAAALSRTRGGRPRTAGFALAEVMIALVMIALIAALAMPGLVRPTGPGMLRASAMNVSALLRDARNSALASGRTTTAQATGGMVRATASGAFVEMPPGALAGPVGTTIRFTPDGRASGGPVTLASSSAAYLIGVDPVTGAIHVATR